MARTKKVGAAGRYGSRYGRSIRKKVLKVEIEKNKKVACPHCLNEKLHRVASGVWLCKKCGLKVAGKAYKPK